MINQKEVSQERIEQWRKHRILKAAKMLNLQLPNTDNTEILDQALLEAKMKLTYEEPVSYTHLCLHGFLKLTDLTVQVLDLRFQLL